MLLRLWEWEGSKEETAKRFLISQAAIYNWLKREDLTPTKVTRRCRKLDWNALRQHFSSPCRTVTGASSLF